MPHITLKSIANNELAPRRCCVDRPEADDEHYPGRRPLRGRSNSARPRIPLPTKTNPRRANRRTCRPHRAHDRGAASRADLALPGNRKVTLNSDPPPRPLTVTIRCCRRRAGSDRAARAPGAADLLAPRRHPVRSRRWPDHGQSGARRGEGSKPAATTATCSLSASPSAPMRAVKSRAAKTCWGCQPPTSRDDGLQIGTC